MPNELRYQDSVTNKQILALRANMEKLEAEMQSWDVVDGASHGAAGPVFDIVKADLRTGNESHLVRLVTLEMAEKAGKASELSKKSLEAVKEALDASNKANQAIKEAKLARDMGYLLLGMGKADEDTQSAEQLRT